MTNIPTVSQMMADNHLTPCVVQPDGTGIAVVCPMRISAQVRELLTVKHFAYTETRENDYVVFAIADQVVLIEQHGG